MTSPTRPPTSDLSPLAERPHRRIEGRARPARVVESRAISALTQALVEAEGRALLAEDDLEDAHAELERRVGELRTAREDRERLHAALPAIRQTAQETIARNTLLEAQLAEQQLVHARLATQLGAERARLAGCAERLAAEHAATQARLAAERETGDARLAALHDQAAEAIRRAERLACTTLEGARSTVGRIQLDCDRQVALALQALAEAQARADGLQAEVDALRHTLDARAAPVPVKAPPVPGPSEIELRLSRDLTAAARENDELRERVQCSERALRSRERALERERKLADEATRWASRSERALVTAPVVGPAGAKPAAQSPIALPRRRGPRIRIRPGG